MKNCILKKFGAFALIAILTLFPVACGSSETESAEECGNEFIALISENPSESSAEQKGSGIAGDVCESDNDENSGEKPEETSGSDAESDISEDKTGGENTDMSDSRSDTENSSDEDEDIFFTVSGVSDSDSDSSDSGSDDTESVFSDSSETVSSALSADADPQTCIHNYGMGVIASNATCTKDGTRLYTCSKCGNTKTEAIPATGHTYETSVTKTATCGTDGVRLHKCAVCGDSYTTTIAATGNHNWQPVYKTVHHDAEGHYEAQKTGMYKCNYSGCGELFETVREVTDHIDSVHDGHASYSGTTAETQNWIQDNAAYDEQVIDYYKCSVCGETK